MMNAMTITKRTFSPRDKAFSFSKYLILNKEKLRIRNRIKPTTAIDATFLVDFSFN